VQRHASASIVRRSGTGGPGRGQAMPAAVRAEPSRAGDRRQTRSAKYSQRSIQFNAGLSLSLSLSCSTGNLLVSQPAHVLYCTYVAAIFVQPLLNVVDNWLSTVNSSFFILQVTILSYIV